MINRPVASASSRWVSQASSLGSEKQGSGLEAHGTHRLEADATDPKLKKAAQGIEASFIKTLLEQMQKGSSMFGKAAGAGIYQDFFNQAVAESMAKTSQFGIADMIERQMATRTAAENGLNTARAEADNQKEIPNQQTGETTSNEDK